MDKSEQKKLKKFITRRHPQYADMKSHWEFLEACYEGGREWFKTNVFRYIKEGDQEYADRVDRAYRFNHTREVVDLVDKYLFKMPATRNKDDAPESVKKFWTFSTLNNLSIDEYMKQISKYTSMLGRVWVVVDTNKTEEVRTKAEEKAQNVRIYSYIVKPTDACDMSYDDEGVLNWILFQESVRDDEDPINSSGAVELRYRLWERDQYTIFRLKLKKGKNPSETNTVSAYELARRAQSLKANRSEFDNDGTKFMGTIAIAGATVSGEPLGNYDIEVEGPYPHGFEGVPVFAADNLISSEPYASTSLIDDVAYLDRAVANYLSNLDAIIQDQTFSQLVMPAQGLTPGTDGYDKMVEMGTKRIFTYDGEGGAAPAYISPDVRQAEIVLKVINKIINEIYHTVGLAGERTKEDNAVGIDNSSGVAKAYDFERVNSLLASKAASLEQIENRLVEFVTRWSGEETKGDEELVSYPENFDVRGLYDEFEIATKLSEIQAPEGLRRLQMEAVVDKLFPRLSKDLKAKMLDELKNWPPKPVEPAEPSLEEKKPGDKSVSSGEEPKKQVAAG